LTSGRVRACVGVEPFVAVAISPSGTLLVRRLGHQDLQLADAHLGAQLSLVSAPDWPPPVHVTDHVVVAATV
jgi:hypothetical protein